MDYLIFSLYLTFYAALHSLLAMQSVKDHISRFIAPHIYRQLYVFLSVVLLTPISLLPLPLAYLYYIPKPWATLLRVVQLAGALGFLWTLHNTDLGAFLGWSRETDTNLKTDGPYRLCRHPLYFFASIALVAEPHVKGFYALFTCWTLIYFWIGSVAEERRLLKEFGDAYRDYQTQTPRMIPKLRS